MKNSGTPPVGIERAASGKPADSKQTTEEREQQIRVRAHRIYEDRGLIDGNEVDDWLQAEAELDGQPNSKAAD